MVLLIIGCTGKRSLHHVYVSGTTRVRNIKTKRRTFIRPQCLCFMLMVLVRKASGILTSTPSDVAVVTGTVFSLRCSTNITQDLLWYRLSPGARSEDHIVVGSQVNERFSRVYSVQYGNQESNLTIVAEQSTAARYACVEMYTNKRATAQVTVLQSKPSCSASGTCDIMNFTCIVIFSGHVNPIVKWTRVAVNEEKEVTVGIENTQRMDLLISHTSTLSVLTNETKRNCFQVYSYRYTVKFCLRDNATGTADDGLCIFSQSISYGEEASYGTTSRIDEEGTVGSSAPQWSYALIAFAVVLTFLSFGLFAYYLYKRKKLHPPNYQLTVPAENEMVEMLAESHKG